MRLLGITRASSVICSEALIITSEQNMGYRARVTKWLCQGFVVMCSLSAKSLSSVCNLFSCDSLPPYILHLVPNTSSLLRLTRSPLSNPHSLRGGSHTSRHHPDSSSSVSLGVREVVWVGGGVDRRNVDVLLTNTFGQ